jgi:creatinine amidohydrolase/Fe(II)-dependent formamide hydrolase-like protein
MLAISPELCDMKKAKLLKVDNPEYPHFWDYREEEMTKSGVMGSAATKATAELGEKILSMAAGKLIREVKKALKEKPRYKAPNKLARAPRGKESKRS